MPIEHNHNGNSNLQPSSTGSPAAMRRALTFDICAGVENGMGGILESARLAADVTAYILPLARYLVSAHHRSACCFMTRTHSLG